MIIMLMREQLHWMMMCLLRVSYEVQLTDGTVVHRHLNHIRLGVPLFSSGDVSESRDTANR